MRFLGFIIDPFCHRRSKRLFFYVTYKRGCFLAINEWQYLKVEGKAYYFKISCFIVFFCPDHSKIK